MPQTVSCLVSAEWNMDMTFDMTFGRQYRRRKEAEFHDTCLKKDIGIA